MFSTRLLPARALALTLIGGGLAIAAGAAAENKPKPAAARVATRPHVPAYNAFVRAWHAPAEGKTAPVDENGRPKLVLSALNTRERVELTALGDSGGFTARDLDRAAHLLRDPGAAASYPVEPRLLDVVYGLQRHFAAQEIRVISGYREPHGGGASNHGKGRAMDLVVPGATDEDVAKFAREVGFVGVGIYPVSGFVHVDVRDRSYFWVDSSGPGRRNRERGVLADVARRADSAATARGERGTPSLLVGSDVDAARAAPQSLAPTLPADDDEDDYAP